MSRPTKICQGDTYEWTESSSDYPAPTYAGKAYLNGASHVALIAIADGSDYDFTLTSAQSAALTPGYYQFQIRAELGSTYYTLYETTIEIVAGGVQAAGYDPRTTARQQLDAVNTAINMILQNPNQSATIGGKSYTRFELGDLYQMKKRLEYDVRTEGGTRKRIFTEFRNPA